MKKAISLLLALVLTLTIVFAVTVTANAEWTVYNVSRNRGNLNVRSAPSTRSKAIGSIPYGESVTAISTVGNAWTCIDWEGGYGYVSSRYLSTKQPSADPEPTVNNRKLAKDLSAEKQSERVVEHPFEVTVVATRATGRINFRSAPSRASARIDRLWDGKPLIVVGETDNWYLASDPATEKIGYIFKRYVKPTGRQLAVAQETAADGDEPVGRLSVNGEFDLTCKLPETYKLQVLNMEENAIFAAVTSDDITKPALGLIIAYDEMYSDVERMNDLPEESLKVIEESFKELDDVDISYAETGHGTKLLVAKENDGDGDTDFVQIFTIYKGYSIEFDMEASKDAAEKSLTDEQIQMMIDFLTDLEFKEVKE